MRRLSGLVRVAALIAAVQNAGITIDGVLRFREPGRAPAFAGMLVGIDPETGRIGMPTPEQRAELEALMTDPRLSHSGDGLVEIRHPDGSASIEVGHRFMEFSVVTTGAHGRLVHSCVNDPRSLARVLRARPAPGAEDR